MTAPEIAPRGSMVGVIAVWIVAAIVAVLVGLIAAEDWRAAWMGVGMGVMVPVAFVVQLWSGRSLGFLQRVAMSVLGSLMVMGLIGVGLGLATLFSAG